MNQILAKLQSEGWSINEMKFMNYIKDVDLQLNYSDVKNFLLNTDIKHYGESWINPSNKSEVQCIGIFQINKIRNVAAPEVDQDNKTNPQLLKYTITDGQSTMFLLDLQSKPKLNNNTEPGCKIFINGNMLFKSGMIILFDNIHVNRLGGKVLDLIKAENIQKTAKNNRVNLPGPPKFTPFGNKLNINVQEIRQFKALRTDPTKDNEEVENTDFGDKREAALAEIRKTKQGDTSVASNKNTLLDKFHGGGTSKFVKETAEKQDQKDSNVAFLMSNGFNFIEVQKSLKANNDDVNAALDHLLQKRMVSHMSISDKEPRGRGKRGRGRGRSNDDEDESWFDPAKYAAKVGLASRPNTTISLAELMGTKPVVETKSRDYQANHFDSNMIGRGYHCLAEVMDGSYQPAIVVDVLPNKCLKIKYLDSGEFIETNVASLKMMTGEKIFEHMIPNVPEKQQQQQSEYKSANYNEYHRGRGRGYPNRRRGGRYHRGY